jgi:acyl-CoA reductase-like NAD-dependent aldehyde dehydrogenase
MRNIISRNPYSGYIAEQLSYASEEQIVAKLEMARQGCEVQKRRQVKERHAMIWEMVGRINRQKEELMKLVSFETGKPLAEAEYEITEAVKMCEYYSKQKDAMATQRVKTNAKRKTLVKCLPTGTVFCLLPSTYPFLLSFYKALPQLLLGNGVMVRPAHDTPRVAREVEKIMKRVGFESGEYQTVWNGYEHTELILGHRQISGASFTGTTGKGAIVAGLAGRYIKKYQVSGTYEQVMVVLEDGNVESAVESALKAGLFHSGQGIVPKVFVVHEQQRGKFRDVLVEKVKKLRVGDPSLWETQVGPISRMEMHEHLRS